MARFQITSRKQFWWCLHQIGDLKVEIEKLKQEPDSISKTELLKIKEDLLYDIKVSIWKDKIPDDPIPEELE